MRNERVRAFLKEVIEDYAYLLQDRNYNGKTFEELMNALGDVLEENVDYCWLFNKDEKREAFQRFLRVTIEDEIGAYRDK